MNAFNSGSTNWALFLLEFIGLFLNIPTLRWCFRVFFFFFPHYFSILQFTGHTDNPHIYWLNLKNASSSREPKVENIVLVINVSCAHTCCMGCGQCIISLFFVTTVTWVFASCERFMEKMRTACQSRLCRGCIQDEWISVLYLSLKMKHRCGWR